MKRSMLLGIGLIFAEMGLSACGGRGIPAGVEAEKSSAATEMAAPELRPDSIQWNFAEGVEADPSLPAEQGADATTKGRPKMVVDQKEVVFTEVVHLPVDPKDESGIRTRPKYLVWDQKTSAGKITHAYYFHQKWDALHQVWTNSSRRNVGLDVDTQRWFIPVMEATGEDDATRLDPMDQYWIILELHTEKGEIKNFRIGFRVLGPLPNIEFQSQAVAFGSEDQISAAKYGMLNGWEVQRGEITNPTGRKLSVKIHLMNSKHKLSQALTAPRFRDTGRFAGSERVIESDPRYQGVEHELEVSQIRVVRADGKGEIYPIQSGKSIRLNLTGHETLNLTWIAYPKESASKCDWPSSEERVFRWETSYTDCSPSDRMREDPLGPPCRTYRQNHETRRTEVWKAHGLQLTGVLRSQVQLQIPGFNEEEMTSPAQTDFLRSRIILTAESPRAVLMYIGDLVSPGWPAGHCRGLWF